MPRKPEKIVEPIDADFDDVVGAMVGVKQKSGTDNQIQKGSDFKIIPYDNDGETVDFRFDPETQEIWASVKAISELYGKDSNTIYEHIEGAYKNEEIQRDRTTRKFRVVRSEGVRSVERSIDFYNLDVILSVGYRVNSKRAAQFRKWSNRILRAYIEQGYILNEGLLREHPEKADKLAAEIRAIRSSEKHIYAKVKECFKVCASDYDKNSKEVRKFYGLLQDKYHYAITGMPASKLILDRAYHTYDNMGLQSFDGPRPTEKDAKIGKNYLFTEELYKMHLLSEQFLIYMEITAARKKKMTMNSLSEKLDESLRFNDFPVFDGYIDYGHMRAKADEHARIEYILYQKRMEIEGILNARGMKYDSVSMEMGEYEGILEGNQGTEITQH